MHVAYVLVFVLGFGLRFCYTVLTWLTFYVLYIQVTVNRDKLRVKQPTRCIKYTKF